MLTNEIADEFVYMHSREANRRLSVQVVEQTTPIISTSNQLAERGGDPSRTQISNSNGASQQFKTMLSFLVQSNDKELTKLELHGYEVIDMQNYSQAGVEFRPVS